MIGGNIADLGRVGKSGSGLSLPSFPTLIECCGGKRVGTGAVRSMNSIKTAGWIPYARFPIGTTFPLRGTRDTTAVLARSSKAVAMYFA